MEAWREELYHSQVKGAKWGVRRYQNQDGSLTPLGRIHYGVGAPRKSWKERFGRETPRERIKRQRDREAEIYRKAKEIAEESSLEDVTLMLDSNDVRYKSYVNEILENGEGKKTFDEFQKEYRIMQRAASDEIARRAEEKQLGLGDGGPKKKDETDSNTEAPKKGLFGKKTKDTNSESTALVPYKGDKKTDSKTPDEGSKTNSNKDGKSNKDSESNKDSKSSDDTSKSGSTKKKSIKDMTTEEIEEETKRINKINEYEKAKGQAAKDAEAERVERAKQNAAAYSEAGKAYKEAGVGFSTAGKYQNTVLNNERAFRSKQTWTRKTEEELSKMSNEEFKDLLNRMDMERQYSELTANDALVGRQKVSTLLYDIGTVTSAAAGVANVISAGYALKEKFNGD